MFRTFKSNALIVFLTLACSSVVFAGPRIGALVGFRSNTIDSDQTTVSYGRTGGYQYGGILALSFFDTLAFRTGIIMADKSTEFAVSGLSGFKANVNYTDIPLTLQLGFPGSSFYVFGGLKYGMNCHVHLNIKWHTMN